VKKKSEKFIQALINLCREGKSLANLVMAVASYTQAKSIVEYSESPFYHYQYSSIGKLFSGLLDSFEGNPADFASKVQLFIQLHRPGEEILRLQLDQTPIFKPHSPTHEGRQSVYRPNSSISGNKPIEIGYNLSCLNIGFFPKISIPYCMERVSVQETGVQVGVRQVQSFCKAEKSDCLIVVTADSSYGTAEYLCPLQDCKNLVTISRFKNRKVYEKAMGGLTGGAPAIYGNAFALRKPNQSTHYKHPKTGVLVAAQTSIFEKTTTDRTEYYTQSAQKRLFLIQITRYPDLLIRSKKGHNMKKKPFDLVIVEYWDAQTGIPLFQKPLYLAVSGVRKDEILLRDIYEKHYFHRYDIEINNRFMKHQLLIDKFQTPIRAHFDLWLVIIQLVEWLLFLAADELTPQPKKWQKSGELQKSKPIGVTRPNPKEIEPPIRAEIPEALEMEILEILPRIEPQPIEAHESEAKPLEENPPRLSLPQARKAAQTLFGTFDQTNLLPQTSKKGKGRKVGTRFPPKPTFKPVKKVSKTKKKENPKGNSILKSTQKQQDSS
jgi:hypothetical protein